MSKWNYKLALGFKLRELINNDDNPEDNCQEMLNTLLKCYVDIQKKLEVDEYWFDNEKEELQDDIDCAAFDEETVNYHLNNFYDTCDQLRVWVGL